MAAESAPTSTPRITGWSFTDRRSTRATTPPRTPIRRATTAGSTRRTARSSAPTRTASATATGAPTSTGTATYSARSSQEGSRTTTARSSRTASPRRDSWPTSSATGARSSSRDTRASSASTRRTSPRWIAASRSCAIRPTVRASRWRRLATTSSRSSRTCLPPRRRTSRSAWHPTSVPAGSTLQPGGRWTREVKFRRPPNPSGRYDFRLALARPGAAPLVLHHTAVAK